MPSLVEVWWAPAALRRPASLALLNAAERRRRDAIRRPLDRNRFTVGAALLRLVVGRQAGLDPTAVTVDRACDTCGEQHGKPRTRDADVGVSVSHSGAWVAVACGRGVHVGVDVEQVCPLVDPSALARDVLTVREAAHLGRVHVADPTRALLTYWTRKEAVLKTTGDGLRIEPSSIQVSSPLEWPRLEAHTARPELVGRLQLWPLQPGPGHVAALGVASANGDLAGSLAVIELDGTPLFDAAG